MNKRRQRLGSAPIKQESSDSSRDSSMYSERDSSSHDSAAPLVGLEPTNPPRKNKLLLMLSGVCFLAWFGFLVWLMVNG